MESHSMEEIRLVQDNVGRISIRQGFQTVSANYAVSLRPHVRLQGAPLCFHERPEGPHGRIISKLHSHRH